MRPRVIPFLLVQNGGLVKTTRFTKPVYIGDPINAVKIFNEKEVDELAVLDIGAASGDREPNFELVKDLASEAFMPIGYGGGLRSMPQVERMFKLGVEKLIFNTALFTHRTTVIEASNAFGAQSIVGSIDVKRGLFGAYSIYCHGARTRVPGKLFDELKRIEDLGVGEIVLNSIDRDGMMQGFDLELIKSASAHVSVPVVGVGGAGTIKHLGSALDAGASAVGAGSMFVFQGRHKAVLISYLGALDCDELTQPSRDS